MNQSLLGQTTRKKCLLFLVPGLHQLRHKSLGEGLVFIVAAFLPLPLAWWLSPFFLIPSVTVAARRLHDSDRSAWWLLLLLIPLLGWFVLFIFMVMDGTRGANRFGPDPKDPAGGNDAQEVFG